MNTNVSSDEKIQETLRNVLEEYRTVQSQNKLTKLVSKKLKSKKIKIGVSQVDFVILRLIVIL